MTPYTHGGDVLTARARFGGDVLDCSACLLYTSDAADDS